MDAFLIGQLVSLLPTLAVLIAGPILLTVARGRLPVRAVVLGSLGCALVLVSDVMTIFSSISLLFYVELTGHWDFDQVQLIPAAVSALSSLIFAVAIALLVGAVLACRSPRPATDQPVTLPAPEPGTIAPAVVPAAVSEPNGIPAATAEPTVWQAPEQAVTGTSTGTSGTHGR